MALEGTFRELYGQLQKLKETLDPLRCLLPDDPLNLEVSLVQHLRESVESVSGWQVAFSGLRAVRDGTRQSRFSELRP